MRLIEILHNISERLHLAIPANKRTGEGVNHPGVHHPHGETALISGGKWYWEQIIHREKYGETKQ